MRVELKEVHIGQEIKKRLEEIKMTKTDFGKLIDVPQQHVNRIFERDTIETKKLVKICQALNFNFFTLYCAFSTNVSAYLSAVALGDGDALNCTGDAATLANLEVMRVKLDAAQTTEEALKGQIATLQANLADKDEIIKLYKDKVQ